MKKSATYAVPGGMLSSNGFFVPHSHGDMARAGSPKRLTDPKLAGGMHRVTEGKLHPHLHGQAVDDETADKLCHGKGNVPTHPGMKQMVSGPFRKDGSILSTETPEQSDAVLREAARLGRPGKC
jgi:hypothetical protein